MDKRIKGVFTSGKEIKPQMTGTKKIVTLGLFAVIAVLCNALIAFITIFLYFNLVAYAILPVGLILLGYIILIVFIRKKAEQKLSFRSAEVFLIFGGVPLVSSLIFYVTMYQSLKAQNSADVTFDGLFALVFAISLCACSAFTMVTLVFISIVEQVKKRKGKDL